MVKKKTDPENLSTTTEADTDALLGIWNNGRRTPRKKPGVGLGEVENKDWTQRRLFEQMPSAVEV